MDFTKEAQLRFAEDKFASDAAGAVIEEASEDHAICSMKIGPIHRNAQEMIMGGAIYTLADFAFAVASNMGHPPTVTLTCESRFMRASRGTCLRAETHCIRSGRTVVFYDVTVTDDLNCEIAEFAFTGSRMTERSEEKK